MALITSDCARSRLAYAAARMLKKQKLATDGLDLVPPVMCPQATTASGLS